MVGRRGGEQPIEDNPKGGGKKRPLGIPTVKDRVVETALILVLMPIDEVGFPEHRYAYRPKRRAEQAMEAPEAMKRELWKGKTAIVDADLSGTSITSITSRIGR